MPTDSGYLPRTGRGAGSDIRHTNSPSEQGRYWIDGDAFPRIILDVPNGAVLVGDGTAYPTPLGGGGGGAPINASYITRASESGLTNESTLGTLFRADVIANRGAFGTAGQMFFATDTLVGYLDTGAAWLAVTPVLDGGGKIAVAAVPNLDFSKITTGTVPIGQGGTGQTTQQAAIDALAGAVTVARVLAGDGTHVTLRALLNADLPATLSGKRITRRVQTLVDAATVTPDADNFDAGILATLSQATLFANPTGTPTDVQQYQIRVRSASPQALTHGTKYRGGVAGLPSATSGGNLTDYFAYEYNLAADTWDCLARSVGY